MTFKMRKLKKYPVIITKNKKSISYFANWMGVINKSWYEDRGLDYTKTPYSCGRIDVDGLDFHKYYEGKTEYDLATPMIHQHWIQLAGYLNSLETEDLLTRDELLSGYEEKYGKINYWGIR